MDDVSKFWHLHLKKKDPQAREALVLHYAPVVKYVVNRLAIRLPRTLEQEDLVSYGIVGLIEALDRFDPSFEVKFETYAIPRIRGQIIDSLRALNLLPRSSYQHAKEIERAVAVLSQELGRIPSNVEIADYLNLDLADYHHWLQEATCVIMSLDRRIPVKNGDELNLYDSLEDGQVLTPAEQVDMAEQTSELIKAIGELSEREQQLISMYYNDGLTMKEIGCVLGVSESRVSQMHTKTMLLLRHIITSNRKSSVSNNLRRNTYASAYAAAG